MLKIKFEIDGKVEEEIRILNLGPLNDDLDKDGLYEYEVSKDGWEPFTMLHRRGRGVIILLRDALEMAKYLARPLVEHNQMKEIDNA